MIIVAIATSITSRIRTVIAVTIVISIVVITICILIRLRAVIIRPHILNNVLLFLLRPWWASGPTSAWQQGCVCLEHGMSHYPSSRVGIL